jgi:hypothetical protein
MRRFYLFELLNQGFVMYFVYVVYRHDGVDDLYRVGFNSMSDLILGMLWPRFIAFLIFMISCPLVLEIQAEEKERAEMAEAAKPCCGLSFQDFTGSEAEMVS